MALIIETYILNSKVLPECYEVCQINVAVIVKNFPLK